MHVTNSTHLVVGEGGGDAKEPSSQTNFWKKIYLNENESIVLKTMEQQDEGK